MGSTASAPSHRANSADRVTADRTGNRGWLSDTAHRDWAARFPEHQVQKHPSSPERQSARERRCQVRAGIVLARHP
jgi:hypothetical protein